MSTYFLYGSQASLFTGKVRGYLHWKGVDFEEFSVTPEIMKSVILKHVGWPVIPVIKTPDGRIVQDTADIMAEVETAHPETQVMPNGSLQGFVSLLLELFADQWLTLPAMHYRWNYNEEWIYSEFGRSSAPDASPEEQYQLGKERGQKFRSFVPLLGINEETIPGIEASYEAFLADFTAHLEQHPFIFGQRPSLADFALLGPLYAHLYRDPASGEIMKRLAPKVADWTERTINGEPGDGPLLSGDIIPETLIPIMARHMEEHLPVLLATNQLLADWAPNVEPGAELPHAFNSKVSFSVSGHSGLMAARCFSLFRLQTALNYLSGLSGDDRVKADELLDRISAVPLKTLQLSHRLERRNCRLMLAL